MRLGVGLSIPSDDPENMARVYASAGYSAAVCPTVTIDQPERIRAIQDAFQKQDVLLAELGVWNNMLHPDQHVRRANLQTNIDALAVADEVGVRCCVNIAGSFDPDRWDGPHPKNLSEEAFELTVENVKQILVAVKPKRTYYTLETMPWVIPDSIESYQQLLAAVDHPMFAVHLDPVNMINSPARFYDNAGFLRECFAKLGEKIVSVHAKDIRMEPELTVHLQEVRPGLGELDYQTFLLEMGKLPLDTPFILEHLPQEEYLPAQRYVLDVARSIGVAFYKIKQQGKNGR
jgi:sugar phosphate isomerase/epimerase